MSDNQRSKILNGLGPQSTVVDLSMIGQWSEKVLGKVIWVLVGHLSSHSGDIKNISSLLLDVPFGLNQVNFLPIHGGSTTSKSSIHSLNSLMLLVPGSLWQVPNLSAGSLMLLKLPRMHYNSPDIVFFSCLTCSHSDLLFWRSQGEYIVTILIGCASLIHSPTRRIKPLPMNRKNRTVSNIYLKNNNLA